MTPRVALRNSSPFRPEFAPRWLGASHVSMQTLRKLSRRESDAFIGQLTGGKALPSDIEERIIAYTDGVPLIMSELTRAVLEGDLLTEEADTYVHAGPLPALAIPTSLQASLMTRLDCLAPLKASHNGAMLQAHHRAFPPLLYLRRGREVPLAHRRYARAS